MVVAIEPISTVVHRRRKLYVGLDRCQPSKRWGPSDRASLTKQSQWFIKFDEHLEALLEAEGIEDKNEQALVCGALVALGLADRKMVSKHADKLHSQEHQYTSTKAMRKRVKEWLYSTKHWAIGE